MAEKRRMSPLKTDEVILLIDAYFRIKKFDMVSLRNECVSELSNSMRSLPFYPEFLDDETFRSCAVMNMCLTNIVYIDPRKSVYVWTWFKFATVRMLELSAGNFDCSVEDLEAKIEEFKENDCASS